MTKWICTDPDEHQWQRRLDDGSYEMVGVTWIGYLEEVQYSAAHGIFKLDDYADDLEYILESYGEEGVLDDYLDDYIAECVFECNICDFDLESFDTEEEAVAWINKFVED